MQKGFSVLIVIFTILAVIAATLSGVALNKYISQKNNISQGQIVVSKSGKNETLNEAKPLFSEKWKTYTNEKYKFTLRYPPDVNYKNVYYSGGSQDDKNLAIVFKINNGSLMITPNNPLEGNHAQSGSPDGASPGNPLTTYSIAGITTGKRIFDSKIEGTIEAISSPTGDKIYFDFTLPKDETERLVVDKLIDQILSTFKFTDQIGETTNWKTLIGSHSTVQEPPYSFQYPETWISETDVLDDPLKHEIFFESGKILITKDLQLSDSNPQTILKGAYIGTFGQSNIFESSKSFDQNLADFDANINSNKLQIVKEERFVLDGQPARKSVDSKGSVEVVFEYPKNKGYMYLTLTSTLKNFAQNQIIFDQMLSTFKFQQ